MVEGDGGLSPEGGGQGGSWPGAGGGVRGGCLITAAGVGGPGEAGEPVVVDCSVKSSRIGIVGCWLMYGVIRRISKHGL